MTATIVARFAMTPPATIEFESGTNGAPNGENATAEE
jgi:hypothetical protein